MLLGVSERLSENIMTGLRGSKSGIFQPQCILNNPTTGFNLELPYINYFVIEQKFDQTYMDMFGLGIDVRPRELRKLIESQQDLECTLILTPLNEFACFTSSADKVSFCSDIEVVYWSMET